MLGIVLDEAMATGLPVAANDTPGLRWITGPAGCLAELEQPGVLAGRIDLMLDEQRREALSRTARRHVLANFSEGVIVEQILQMYEQVMEQTG